MAPDNLKDMCLGQPPILDSILDSLTGMEASLFLHALGLTKWISPDIREKYVNIRRDLIPLEGWINSLHRRHDTVLLVGDHLNELMKMYEDIDGYWENRKTLPKVSIWCLGISKRGYQISRKLENRESPTTQVILRDLGDLGDLVDLGDLGDLGDVRTYGIKENGQLCKRRYELANVHPPETCGGEICMEMLESTHVFLPGPGMWPKCYSELTSPEAPTLDPICGNSITIHFASQFSGAHIKIAASDRPANGRPTMCDVTDQMTSLTYMDLSTNKIKHSFSYNGEDPEKDTNHRSIDVTYASGTKSSEQYKFKITF